jgi:hypothetical protein
VDVAFCASELCPAFPQPVVGCGTVELGEDTGFWLDVVVGNGSDDGDCRGQVFQEVQAEVASKGRWYLETPGCAGVNGDASQAVFAGVGSQEGGGLPVCEQVDADTE